MEAKSKPKYFPAGRIIKEPTEPEPPTPGSPSMPERKTAKKVKFE